MSPLIAFNRGIRWVAGPFGASSGAAAARAGNPEAAKVTTSHSAAADVVRHRRNMAGPPDQVCLERKARRPPPMRRQYGLRGHDLTARGKKLRSPDSLVDGSDKNLGILWLRRQRLAEVSGRRLFQRAAPGGRQIECGVNGPRKTPAGELGADGTVGSSSKGGTGNPNGGSCANGLLPAWWRGWNCLRRWTRAAGNDRDRHAPVKEGARGSCEPARPAE